MSRWLLLLITGLMLVSVGMIFIQGRLIKFISTAVRSPPPDVALNLNVQQSAQTRIDRMFQDAITERATDGTIVLSSVDSGYLDMAINLYLTSFKRYNIDNYLFVGSDSRICDSLRNSSIACFDYIHDPEGEMASNYFSEAFKRKTHLKTKIILEALKLCLNVLIVDVDIVFFTNPLPLFTCKTCDIEISSDVIEGNSGFYLARPTPAAVKLHETAWKQGLQKPHISNQKAIDRNMERMVKTKAITVNNLDPNVYTNGKVYFEDGKRMFKGDNPCKGCVIVHNNWIVTGAAKIYRFKECGLWENDRNAYYSDKERKYISFDLPTDFGSANTQKAEKNSLHQAFFIGAILGRTVILPQFHCYGCKYNGACKKAGARCSFGTFYKIEQLDSQLEGKYRESVFLSHDKVPASVKKSSSPVFFIDSLPNNQHIKDLPRDVVKVTPTNQAGVTIEEIVLWFGNRTESILRFHSLYVDVKYDGEDERMRTAVKKLNSAIVDSDYRQYKG